MAFDGITVAAVVQELEHTLVGGRISKIAQPENDELLLTIKGNEGQKALYLCQCFSSTHLFNQREQTKSDDSSWILHASAQAYRRRTDHRSLPAITRTYHPPGY